MWVVVVGCGCRLWVAVGCVTARVAAQATDARSERAVSFILYRLSVCACPPYCTSSAGEAPATLAANYPLLVSLTSDFPATMAEAKASIKAADMSEDMQQEAIDCAASVCSVLNTTKKVATLAASCPSHSRPSRSSL